MTDESDETQKPTIQADNKSVAVGSIAIGGSTGDISIHAGDIGYSVEEVSVLLTQITSTFQPKPFDGRSPYKGLDVFDEEDADLFFGREKLVDDLVSRVKESRTVFVTGPSGSGKSSLVRAGLIPALKRGGIKNSERWLYETMKPGRDPLGELGRVASSLTVSTNAEDEIRAKAMADETIFARWCEIALKDSREKRAVIFIDQFEEAFTQINKEERLAFLNLLTHAATVEKGRVIILFSMRSDFVSNCATYPKLNALLNQQFIQIGAMQPDELVSAIAQPALRVGLRIDPDLVAQIINEMRGEPGALPLMQFALKDLFDSRQEKGGIIALTLGDYLERGGIHKALERHADKAFAGLSENEQELAHSIFGGLIEIGRGTQDTRRIAQFDELISANSNEAEVQAVLQKLADARLITTDEKDSSKYTITHEKLIDAWPWLKKLVNENRDVIALQNEIKSDAKEWDDHKQDPSYLYTGARLANAQEQLTANKLVLSGAANEFVQVGIFRQQRDWRTRMLSIAGVISLIVVAIILFSYISTTNSNTLAEQSKNSENTQAALASTSDAIAVTAQANAEEAQKQARIARAGELVALALSQRDKQFDLSLLLSVEAFRSADIARTRSFLLDGLLTHQRWFWYLQNQTETISAVAFSPKDKILASGSDAGTVILWDWVEQQPIGELQRDSKSYIESIAFNPDGSILAVGEAYLVTLWDTKSLQQIGQPIEASGSKLIFSPDGKKILAGPAEYGNVTHAEYGNVTLWDVASHEFIGKLSPDEYLDEYPAETTSTWAFSPDGKTIVTGGWKGEEDDLNDRKGLITLWDVATLRPLGQTIDEQACLVTSIAFSPDGLMIAAAGPKIDPCTVDEGVIILWNASSLQMIGQPIDAAGGRVSNSNSLAFSPDSRTLASANWTGVIDIWDVESHEIIDQQRGELLSAPLSVAFDPRSGVLAAGGCKNNALTGSCDGAIILWDQYALFPRRDHLDIDATSVAFSPDGKTLAWGSHNTSIRLWDREKFHRTQLPDSADPISYSPDGKILVSTAKDNILLWDVQSQQIMGSLPRKDAENVFSIAFSPDGKILVAGGCGKLDSNKLCTRGVILFWDVASRQPIGEPVNSDAGQVNNIAFSPDGKILAVAQENGTILFLEVASHQTIGKPLGEPIENWLEGNDLGVLSVAFSPNGDILVSGNDNGTIILWDVISHEAIGRPLEKYDDPILAVAISPDGKTLAAGSGDRTLTISLWDLESRQPIGQPLYVGGSVLGLVFSRDGKWLASASDAGPMIWSVDPQSWMERICKRAGRNLTLIEWAVYFPTEPYRATCSQFPLATEATATTSPTP